MKLPITEALAIAPLGFKEIHWLNAQRWDAEGMMIVLKMRDAILHLNNVSHSVV